MRVSVIIPALNEELAIKKVLADIPKQSVNEVIVVDNGSSDRTAEFAVAAGARVIKEPVRGYGRACLCGIKNLMPDTDIVVFLDADYSDYPEELNNIIEPITSQSYDMVIGSRLLHSENRKIISRINWLGNNLACLLIKKFFHQGYTDLGPFRAILRGSLEKLNMEDYDFGWTVEMQIRAALKGLKIREVPVRYRKRIGESKITGTLWGSLRAFSKISALIIKYAIKSGRNKNGEI